VADERGPAGQRGLAAGDFGTWLVEMRDALAGRHPATVPCGECHACCTSSQFIHVAPDETATLARIPATLLFPAPQRPPGHVVMGYDERGHCPMLVDGRCSIYENRPRTCQTYDCRIFPAAGVAVPGADQAGIAEQAGRWRFSFPTAADQTAAEAVQAAAAFLDRHPEIAAPTGRPPNPTALAVLAVEASPAFLRPDRLAGVTGMVAEPDPATVRAELGRRPAAAPGDTASRRATDRKRPKRRGRRGG